MEICTLFFCFWFDRDDDDDEDGQWMMVKSEWCWIWFILVFIHFIQWRQRNWMWPQLYLVNSWYISDKIKYINSDSTCSRSVGKWRAWSGWWRAIARRSAVFIDDSLMLEGTRTSGQNSRINSMQLLPRALLRIRGASCSWTWMKKKKILSAGKQLTNTYINTQSPSTLSDVAFLP